MSIKLLRSLVVRLHLVHFARRRTSFPHILDVRDLPAHPEAAVRGTGLRAEHREGSDSEAARSGHEKEIRARTVRKQLRANKGAPVLRWNRLGEPPNKGSQLRMS